MGTKPRSTCNCKNSQCVKGYCNCFLNRRYCSESCRCDTKSCLNISAREALVDEHDERRLRSKSGAFQSKGCTCRKSECKKNYCECFKNQVACTDRCNCEGCANTHGAKGGVELLHNNGGSGGTSGDSNGTSDGGSGSGTLDGSDGISNETTVITDEDSVSPTDVVAFVEPLNIGQHVYAPSDSDLYAFFKPLPDQAGFFQNVHTLGSVQTLQNGSTNFIPQGPLNPNINRGSQDGPGGN